MSTDGTSKVEAKRQFAFLDAKAIDAKTNSASADLTKQMQNGLDASVNAASNKKLADIALADNAAGEASTAELLARKNSKVEEVVTNANKGAAETQAAMQAIDMQVATNRATNAKNRAARQAHYAGRMERHDLGRPSGRDFALERQQIAEYSAFRDGQRAAMRSDMTTLEKVQLGLDVAGMTDIPVVSQLAELGSAGISVYNGDYVGAGLSVGSMIPIAGKAFEGTKAARLAENVITSPTTIKTNGVSEQASLLSEIVPGMSNKQATALLDAAFDPRKPVEVVLGGSRVKSFFGKGEFRSSSDLDIGFNAKMKNSQIDRVLNSFDEAGELVSERGIKIFSGNKPPSGVIESPQEFFQRSGIRDFPPERAGEPFGPSGYISISPDGTMTLVPPRV